MSIDEHTKLVHHVSSSEDDKFGKIPLIERQCMYARGVALKKHEILNAKGIRTVLKWKFGNVLLTTKQIEGIIEHVRSSSK